MNTETHVILTFLKSAIKITKAEEAILRNLPLDGWFETKDGTRIKGSAIAEVVPIQEYYRRNPDERPVDTTQEFRVESRETYQSIEQKAEYNKRVSFGLLKGLRKFCLENPDAKIAKAMYDSKLAAYKRHFGLVENETVELIKKEFCSIQK